MQAIEFTATPQNGVVEIPSEHQEHWGQKKLRVILIEIDDAAESPRIPLLSRLQQIKISAPEDFSENLDHYLNERRDA